jgi:hypothetical protein
LGLGRLFFLNRYILMKRSEEKDEQEEVSFKYSIGVSDRTLEEDLSGLWLVYSISFVILGVMILLFIVKTICLWNREDSKAEDE